MKTSELTGAALDWAVHYIEHGQCEGYSPQEYSTDWSQGGPIIERESIGVWQYNDSVCRALSNKLNTHIPHEGLTLLIAAMRCYVASKLGDTVEIPKELE